MTDFVTVKVAKWTPGMVRLKAGASYVQTDNGVMNIVAQTWSGCDSDRFEAAAYAQLFAAAPDLYAACVEFVRKVDAGEAKSTRSYQQMKAAIAKAEAR